MKHKKPFKKIFTAAAVLCTLFVLNCADVPRDNAADRGGEKYNNIYADNRITEFRFDTLGVAGFINDTDNTIVIPVLYGTDVTSLAAEFVTNAESVVISGREQRSGITVNDFREALYYEVTAFDGSKREYTVTTREVAITSFKITDPVWNETIVGTINYDNYTITVSIPCYMNISNLIADFDVVGNVSIGAEPQIHGTTVSTDLKLPEITEINLPLNLYIK